MQTTRNRITAAAEFSTGVKNGQNDLNGADALGRVHTDRNTAAIVLHANPAVFGDGDFDDVAESGERFVN